jgi:glycine/D-amino acid oxidase-like deaminating enzyme
VIVGAGIFGVTAALELRRRGWSVTLCDPGPLPHPDAASTDISKAVRMDYGTDGLHADLAAEALAGWDDWNRTWEEPPFHPDGFLVLAGETMQPGGFEHDSFVTLRARGYPLERLSPAELRRRFPAWRTNRYPDGYFNPRAGWAESGRVVERLIREARASGVALREGIRFERLCEHGSRVAGIDAADGETIAADHVLVAAGAWTPTLLPHLADVMWATGHPVLHFQPANADRYRAPRFAVWAADIGTTGWYGFPAIADGRLKIGNHGPGIRIDPRAPRQVPAGWEARTRDFLSGTIPDLAAAPLVETRLCLYCDTWDGNFWIDHDPEREGLIVAAGDSGHGFKFAPLLGRLIADVIERNPNPVAERFAWRARGTLRTEDARSSGA